MPGERNEGPCPTCYNSMKRGLLWIGGKDYVECPDCDGTGTFICYEHRVTPGKSIAVNGNKVLIARYARES